MLDAPQTIAQLHGARAQGLLQRPRRFTASCRTSSCRTAIRAATGKGARLHDPRRAQRAPVPARARSAWRSSWRDTGGSQFFITHSPQPHLDARYTVFGQVVNGMDVVDRIQQGDVIQRVRVWDGRMTDRIRRSRSETEGRRLVSMQKRGRRPPPSLAGERQLTASCRPSSSPALGRLLRHCAYPPLHSWDSDREELSPHRSAAAVWHVGLPLSAPVASLRELPRDAGGRASKKLGVSRVDTPGPAGGASSASFRPFSCRP